MVSMVEIKPGDEVIYFNERHIVIDVKGSTVHVRNGHLFHGPALTAFGPRRWVAM